MARLEDHPTVRALRERPPLPSSHASLEEAWLRQLCLDAGADDVGFVEVERPELAEERSTSRPSSPIREPSSASFAG
jgi:hypothetical protein